MPYTYFRYASRIKYYIFMSSKLKAFFPRAAKNKPFYENNNFIFQLCMQLGFLGWKGF